MEKPHVKHEEEDYGISIGEFPLLQEENYRRLARLLNGEEDRYELCRNRPCVKSNRW